MTHPEPQSTEALLEEIASFDVEAFLEEEAASFDVESLIAELDDVDTLIEEVNAQMEADFEEASAQIEADLAAIARGEFIEFPDT